MENSGIFEFMIEAIKSLGFPIVMVGALFWYVLKKDKQHAEEMNTIKTALDNNSSILNELKGLITAVMGELKK